MGRIVEPWVEEAFFERVENVQLRQAAHDDELDALVSAAADADAELEAYRDSLGLLRTLGEDRFVAGLETRVRAADAAHDAVVEFQQANQPAALPKVADLRVLWPDMTVEQRRRILSSAIDGVVLRSVGQANVPISSRALILWRGEMPADFPRRGRRVPLASFEWPPGAAGEHLGED
jgi:hypothetical protein